MSLSEAAQSQVDRFCYQYLQLEKDLDYPESSVLREEATQEHLVQRLFSENGPCYPPPARYQLRTLKELVRRIEASIEDWDAHVRDYRAITPAPSKTRPIPVPDPRLTGLQDVSENLMTALTELLATPLPSELSSAQQKSYVTYNISPLKHNNAFGQTLAEPDITLLEARSLISASGTTGLRTWEAALHLGQYLCLNPDMVRAKRVLELGAGTGYLAVLCAKYLRASHVVASDGSDDVINNIPESFFLNDLQGSSSITPLELKWGHALIGTEDQQWNNGEAIDLVIGADITYDESIIPALVGTLEDIFSMFSFVEVLISATERNQKTFESFQRRCHQSGFSLTEIEFPIPSRERQTGPFYNDAVPIRICKISTG